MAAPTRSAVVNEIIESFSAKDLGRLRTLVPQRPPVLTMLQQIGAI
ncbi:MAG: hypothetical protein QOD57_3312 [Actinomycetota bacterium]|nr:hypothetical protein [Actinomycetota bacterium]